ncbi:hypothetical protein HGO23_12790 [Xenorhabdus budapestensis]|uniref:Uncharacterized protein n=1 Tax=Xenorhabdus budapestensis TaxID=290110 RepID=A0ABX7VE40_XENBU|nr:hypothetical protein [Xenorhabdus budapestensis]QTL38755.1 hypothetical protein HGO23_12790 [Xenorhabdus budapestensis]
MKLLASKVLVQQYCHGLNEIEFPEGVRRIDSPIEKILDVSQWSMPEVVQYFMDRDLMDSFMEELEKVQQRVA